MGMEQTDQSGRMPMPILVFTGGYFVGFVVLQLKFVLKHPCQKKTG